MKKALVMLLVLVAVIGTVFAQGGGESSSDVKVLKIGSTSPAGSSHHQALQYFQEKLKEVSGGKMDSTLHMGGTLGTTAQEYAQLKEGSLDVFLTAFDTASVLKGGKDFTVVRVPYAFDDMDHYFKFVESDLCKGMIAEVEKQNGIHFMGVLTPTLPRALSTTNKPVSKVSDVSNMKIRVSETQSIYEMWKAWGANPVIISGGELYTALESGLADGQDNDVAATYTSGMGEIQKYYTELNYIQQSLVTWFSQKNWDKLTEEQQGWINQAMKETCEEFGEIMNESYATSKQALIDAGVTFVDADIQSFKDATAEAVKAMDGVLFTKGLYDQIRALNN